MFEAAELGRSIDKAEFSALEPELRSRLLEAQRKLVASDIPVVVIIAGVEGAGKARVLDRLTEWLDVRHIDIHTVGARPASDEESERPEYWRFWRKLPARGRIGLFLGSWYTKPVVERATEKMKVAAFERQLARIARLERMLVQDGALILKFWLHLSREEQRKRFEKLESDKRTRWRVTKEDWKYHKTYDRFSQISEVAIRQTDTGYAPWHLVESVDSRYRDLTIGRILADSLEQRLAQDKPNGSVPTPALVDSTLPLRANGLTGREGPASTGRRESGELTVLDKVDLSQKLEEEEYERLIEQLQEEVGRLARDAYERGRSTILLFEGWDAAGKGGAIRRVARALDARIRQVIQIAAPTDEERGHHYLWRFWRHVPRAGCVTVYDRSWYGRVLVERVECFAAEEEWKRAYNEINDFEEQLTEHGIAVIKFWIHISKDEQLSRFEERETTPYKRHKIGEEDWRNREKWDRYEEAINEMVSRCSTSYAPWTIIPGNDKKFARVEVLKTIRNRLRGPRD